MPAPAPAAPEAPAIKVSPDKSLAFATNVAKMAVADKCHQVTILDVRGISPITDYLVLATGTSGRQMRGTADDCIQLGKDHAFRPLSSSGLDGEIWICVDFVHVLLHIFSTESRQYYDLDGLWGDAKHVDFTPGPID
jgi:ribosome-associated protein